MPVPGAATLTFARPVGDDLDEVLAAMASMFGVHARANQARCAQAAQFHARFVQPGQRRAHPRPAPAAAETSRAVQRKYTESFLQTVVFRPLFR